MCECMISHFNWSSYVCAHAMCRFSMCVWVHSAVLASVYSLLRKAFSVSAEAAALDRAAPLPLRVHFTLHNLVINLQSARRGCVRDCSRFRMACVSLSLCLTHTDVRLSWRQTHAHWCRYVKTILKMSYCLFHVSTKTGVHLDVSVSLFFTFIMLVFLSIS